MVVGPALPWFALKNIVAATRLLGILAHDRVVHPRPPIAFAEQRRAFVRIATGAAHLAIRRDQRAELGVVFRVRALFGQGDDLRLRPILRVPKQIVVNRRRGRGRALLLEHDGDDGVRLAEHLVHHAAHPMQVLVADLHEDAAGIRQQFPRHRQPVAQIGQVAVDAAHPSIPIGFDHLRLARQILLPILHVALAKIGLEVGAKADAVGRIEVDHLHLAGQILPPRQTRHHLQRIAKDHAIRPIHIVPVELHRLRVIVLRIRKQIAVHILPRQHPQNRLRGHPLVHMQRHRIHLKPLLLPLPTPLQPRLLLPDGRAEGFGLFVGERPLAGQGEELRRAIGLPIRRRPQHGWQMRVVRELHRRLIPHHPLRLQASRRDVLARGSVLDGAHGLAAGGIALWCASHVVCGGPWRLVGGF